MQFTYTFPPLLRLGYDVITDAMANDEVYVPGKGSTGRIDNWSQWSRWRRVSFGCMSSLAVLIKAWLMMGRDFLVGGGTTNYLT